MREWFPKEGVVLLGIYSIGRVGVFQLIAGFRDSQGLSDSVSGRVCDTEPGEFKDDVFSAAAHDIEAMFLDNPFNVCV